MVTNDLGACEWFVWDLRRSGLIDRGQLDQIVSEFLKKNPRAEAPALAEYLVHQGTLTAFQAERILNGKTQGLALGPYILLDAIGQGSMGQVYKANSKNDTNLYAVKVLPRRSMWNVRLARRQVRSFGQFTHPAVVPFVDVGTAGGLHYLVWPMAEGQPLDAMVNNAGRLSVPQAALVGVQVAQGLAVCHQNNLFHGLVKPSNVMVGPDGQTRILDFGIGSLLVENEGESLVDTMSTANTLTSGLDCASPESILEPTNRTPAGDQYSLGCVLYYCLTGRVPFPEGSAVEKMMAHQTKEPTSVKELVPEIPDAVAEVVRRLMAKKPEDRYGGCDEVVEALEPFLGELAGAGAAPVAAAAGAAAGPGRSGYRPQGLGGSSGRMAGLATGPAGRPAPVAGRPAGPATPATGPMPVPGFPARGGFPAATPIPAGTPAARASMGGFPGGSGIGPGLPASAAARASAAAIPSRSSFQPPDASDVPLTPAADSPPFPAPYRSSIPGGWMPGTEEPRRPAFGTLGIIAATVILMVLVFLGAKLVMN